MPDVVLEVELGIVDPVGVVEVHGHPHELLPEDRRGSEPVLDVLQDRLEAKRLFLCRRRVVDIQGGDVLMTTLLVREQVKGVASGYLSHAVLLLRNLPPVKPLGQEGGGPGNPDDRQRCGAS